MPFGIFLLPKYSFLSPLRSGKVIKKYTKTPMHTPTANFKIGESVETATKYPVKTSITSDASSGMKNKFKSTNIWPLSLIKHSKSVIRGKMILPIEIPKMFIVASPHRNMVQSIFPIAPIDNAKSTKLNSPLDCKIETKNCITERQIVATLPIAVSFMA